MDERNLQEALGGTHCYACKKRLLWAIYDNGKQIIYQTNCCNYHYRLVPSKAIFRAENTDGA